MTQLKKLNLQVRTIGLSSYMSTIKLSVQTAKYRSTNSWFKQLQVNKQSAQTATGLQTVGPTNSRSKQQQINKQSVQTATDQQTVGTNSYRSTNSLEQ